ncbi:MFS transporter [Gulosibacter macacae]|nr:aromatic acid/H+ symport family MFS transporter [Gulosibacter macacae]
MTQTRSLVLRHRAWITPLCWIAVMLDGFDAVVLGAAMPMLIDDPNLAVDAATGTFIATLGLFGMMLGALAMGWATDRFGRRKLLIGAVIAFSILTFATGFVNDPYTMAVLRFAAGVGLGGCLPTAISMMTEFSPSHRGSFATTLTMTGYHVGAVLTALLALLVAQEGGGGWREMFIIGGLPSLILVPLMIIFLPESPDYLASHGRLEDAKKVANHYGIELDPMHLDGSVPAGQAAVGTKLLLAKPFVRNTVLIWVASFMGLLLVYGLNTWLPQIMRAAEYDLGNALGFLVILNLGGIIGLLVAGWIGDRITPRIAGIIWFLGSAALLAALAIKLPLLGVYVLIFVTGAFVFSSQVLVYAFVAANHPSRVRATALGGSAGVGRLGAISGPIVGGTLLGAGLAYPWGFFAFAIVGLIGGIALSGTKTRTKDELATGVLDTLERAELDRK